MQTAIRVLVILILFPIAFDNCVAQRKPLVPNGKPQTRIWTLASFDTLELLWLDGKIEVEFGADTSTLEIVSDENIMRLIQVQHAAGSLQIQVAGNDGNRLWLEDDKTTVKIRTTAQPHQIIYKCNADAVMRGVATENLSVEKDMNGDVKISGKAGKLFLRKDDNGNIYASDLAVLQADISISGNGDVRLNAQKFDRREAFGKGGISNEGEAGNSATAPKQRVKVTFFNNRASRGDFFVTGLNEAGKTFSYGLELGAFAKDSESLPVGTRVFQGSRSGKLLLTLKEGDDRQTLKLYE